MRIWNFTPHAINIVDGATFNPSIRKFTGGNVVQEIPSDGMLNAKIETVENGSIENNGIAIPMYRQNIVGCDDIPLEVGENDIVIVSALYAQAFRASGGTFPLYGVKDPVMSDDGKTFRGCRGLQQF